MMKWLVTLLIVLVILAVATPFLRPLFARAGLRRMPGDFRIPVRGRMFYLPIGSTVVFTFLVWLLGKLL